MLGPRFLLCFCCIGLVSLKTASAQDLKQRPATSAAEGTVQISTGTHILLNMINSVSTKEAMVGDRIYLATAFPVLADSRIVIPQGSWVTGTVTAVKRPGKIKGRGLLRVRFDSLTLPNGVTRKFQSDLGAIDSRSGETLRRDENSVESAGNKKGDVGTVVGASTAGTIIGSGVGAAAGNVARGAGMGAGAGAAAGLIGVLTSRGPDAVLTKGSTVEMVLDRPISFSEADLNFNRAPRANNDEQDPPSVRKAEGANVRVPF